MPSYSLLKWYSWRIPTRTYCKVSNGYTSGWMNVHGFWIYLWSLVWFLDSALLYIGDRIELITDCDTVVDMDLHLVLQTFSTAPLPKSDMGKIGSKPMSAGMDWLHREHMWNKLLCCSAGFHTCLQAFFVASFGWSFHTTVSIPAGKGDFHCLQHKPKAAFWMKWRC